MLLRPEQVLKDRDARSHRGPKLLQGLRFLVENRKSQLEVQELLQPEALVAAAVWNVLAGEEKACHHGRRGKGNDLAERQCLQKL